jgi:hypothetical protein
MWRSYLKESPSADLHFPPESLPNGVAFDPDEDIVLLMFIRSESSMSFQRMISQFHFIFHPFRSIASIVERIEDLRTRSPSEIDEFYDDYITPNTS